MTQTKYIFENHKVYAIREGKVVDSATSIEDLEKVAGPLMGQPEMGAAAPQPPVQPPMQGDPHAQGGLVPCPGCGAEVPGQDEVCPHCGTPLAAPQGGGVPDPMMGDPMGGGMPAPATQPGIMASSHVVTPSGIKGKVLARTPDLWGDTVTIRLDNGRIAHVPVSKVSASVEKTAGTQKTASERLSARLDAPVQGDARSLHARLEELDEIRHEASMARAAGEDVDLAGITLTANMEEREIKIALEGLNDLNAQQFQAPTPYGMDAAPASGFGLTQDGWLDNTVSEMIAEAEGQDFDQIISEEPQTLVSDLQDGTLADMGSTREVAMAHIRSKVAGLDSDIAAEIETRFLANVEAARRAAVVARKAAAHTETATKQASVIDLPDDVLFGL